MRRNLGVAPSGVTDPHLRAPGVSTADDRSPGPARSGSGAWSRSAAERCAHSSPWFRRARRGFVPQPWGLLTLRSRRVRARSSRSLFALDESLDPAAALVVGQLHRRALHQVRRRGDDRATEAAVFGDLRRTQGVDDDAGGVRGVPDLELVLQVQRRVTERAALEADVGPLAVVEPRHVVRWTDLHVAVEVGLAA